MKKKLSVFLALVTVLACSFGMSAYAMPVQNTHDDDHTATKISLDYDFLSKAVMTENNGVLLLSRKTKLDTSSVRNAMAASAQNSYKNETVYIIPDEKTSVAELKADINNYLYSARSTGNKTESNYDPSCSITGNITIYYDRTPRGSVDMVKLNSVSGSYTGDGQVAVLSQNINAGNTGWAEGGWKEQATSFSKTGKSWTYTAPNTWVPVNMAATHFVGANCTYTLKRTQGSSTNTWTFSVDNNL